MGYTCPLSTSNSVRVTRTTFILGTTSSGVKKFLQEVPTYLEAATNLLLAKIVEPVGLRGIR